MNISLSNFRICLNRYFIGGGKLGDACRHTFCSNMAKSGMNPKMLQYIMGHSDISVTMNTYTHVKFQDAQEDFQKAINA